MRAVHWQVGDGTMPVAGHQTATTTIGIQLYNAMLRNRNNTSPDPPANELYTLEGAGLGARLLADCSRMVGGANRSVPPPEDARVAVERHELATDECAGNVGLLRASASAVGGRG